MILVERNDQVFNLQSEFNFLNKTLFNNKVKPLPVRWYKMRRLLGVYHYRFNRATRDITSNDIKITTLYSLSQQQLREVLAHEMIHAYIAQNKLEFSNHGPIFLREAARITALGYRITVFNDQPLEVDEEHDIELPIILAKMKSGVYGLTLICALSVFASNKMSFLTSLQNIYGRVQEPELYRVPLSKVSNFRRTNITSTFKIKWYKISEAFYNEIRNECTLIKKYEVRT